MEQGSQGARKPAVLDNHVSGVAEVDIKGLMVTVMVMMVATVFTLT